MCLKKKLFDWVERYAKKEKIYHYFKVDFQKNSTRTENKTGYLVWIFYSLSLFTHLCQYIYIYDKSARFTKSKLM